MGEQHFAVCLVPSGILHPATMNVVGTAWWWISGQNWWPSARWFVTATGQDLMATDTAFAFLRQAVRV